MKRTRLLLPILLVFGLLAAPLAVTSTAAAAAPPTLELAIAPILDVTPLAAAANPTTPAIVPADDGELDLPPPSDDPSAWFELPRNLAAVLVIIVAFLKKNVLKTDGLQTVAVSAAAALAITLYGRVVGWHERSLGDSLTFAFTAFVYASGGWAALTQLLGALGKVISGFLGKRSGATA